VFVRILASNLEQPRVCRACVRLLLPNGCASVDFACKGAKRVAFDDPNNTRTSKEILHFGKCNFYDYFIRQ
jgi:hypothetical protein